MYLASFTPSPTILHCSAISNTPFDFYTSDYTEYDPGNKQQEEEYYVERHFFSAAQCASCTKTAYRYRFQCMMGRCAAFHITQAKHWIHMSPHVSLLFSHHTKNNATHPLQLCFHIIIILVLHDKHAYDTPDIGLARKRYYLANSKSAH